MAVELAGGAAARLLEVLGRSDDVRPCCAACGRRRAWPAPWPQEVEEELAALPADPLPADPARVDLRDRLTFTIDPPDARDFDDAIGVEREQGGLRVFVHIADVSAFVVAAGSAIDDEAAWRGCSVYLPGRVEPMLPHALSSDVCSLQPGVDRYAVTIEVAPDGRLTAYRSRSAATTGSATRRWSGCWPGTSRRADDRWMALRDARDLSERLRAARFARGAARIDSREVEFELRGGPGG